MVSLIQALNVLGIFIEAAIIIYAVREFPKKWEDNIDALITAIGTGGAIDADYKSEKFSNVYLPLGIVVWLISQILAVLIE